MINFFYQDYNKQILNGIYKKFKKFLNKYEEITA